MRNARACESCRASKNRCYFADDHTICRRCDQTKSQCIVREKARPRRARRAQRSETTTKVEDSGPSSIAPPSVDNSAKDGEFSLNLPITVYHDPTKEVEGLQNHHERTFKDDHSRSPTPSKETLNLSPKYISGRKLTLPQATHLLNSFIPKLPFFPFITLPANPTIPTLSQQSPFLLLAILTTAAMPHPYLHHQLDQEFRRVLSLKLIVESQKSLDYLLGLLVYIAWFPVHTKPKSNPCFTYMNLANSIALDLGLDQTEPPQASPFRELDLKGLVDSNGGWTLEARMAYMGCYVLGARLSKGWNKPQTLSYENLLPSNSDSFVPSHASTPATAIVMLERIYDRINDAWTSKNYPQMDVFSTELYIQLFSAELETWKRNVPEYISSSRSTEAIPSPNHLHTCLRLGASYLQHLLSLPTQDYRHFNIIQWSHLVHALVAYVRLTFVIAHVENWSAETTREKVGLSMYLEALCFRLGSLSSNSQLLNVAGLESNEAESIDKSGNGAKTKYVDKYFIWHSMLSMLKRSWEQRVNAIVPKAPVISSGKCPMYNPEVAPLLDNPSLDFDFGDMGGWDDSFGEGMAEWSTSMEGFGAGSAFAVASLDPPGSGGIVVTGEGGIVGGLEMANAGAGQQGIEGPIYHDLWATMTGPWAEQPSAWPSMPMGQGNAGIGGDDSGFGYQVNEG